MIVKNEDLLDVMTRELIFDDYPYRMNGTDSTGGVVDDGRWPTSVLKDWPSMESVLPSLIATFVYLMVVLKLGPVLMNRRSKPYKLTAVMMLYNLSHMIFSLYVIIRFFCGSETYQYFIDGAFNSKSHIVRHEMEMELATIAWYYLASKYVEFLDTIFFVLRKKQGQVTFLHVYHHANMAVSTWLYVKYVRAKLTIPIAILNCSVHFVMYGYYMLSALGPTVRPYLWWKKYITRIQMTQFVLVIIYISVILYKRTPIQKIFCYFTVVNTLSFLVLFLNFYIKTYRSRSKLTGAKGNTGVNRNGACRGDASAIHTVSDSKKID